MKAAGVIGLGAIGRGMAQSLRRAGFAVHVHDIREHAVRTFATEGGVACSNPAEVASQCDVVFCAVVDAAQVEEVLFGTHGVASALRPGGVFVMNATVDPAFSAAMESRVEAAGLLYLDAPVSGSAEVAAAGQLTLITAGRARAYDVAGDALDAVSARIYRVGDRAGAGSTVKIINQLLVGVHIAAAAEALALGLRQGVDPASLYEVITHSAGNSLIFEQHVAKVLKGDYAPGAALDIHVKDLGLVLDAAQAATCPLPLASAAHRLFLQAAAAGLGREGSQALVKVFPGIRAPGT